MKKEITWFLIRLISGLFRLLPHGRAVALGGYLGAVLWFFSRNRVDRAEKRAVRALGLGVTIARKIVRGSYENLGRAVAEMSRLPWMLNRLDKFITFHGEDNLTRAIEKGKGVIFLTSHMGNWEMLAAQVSAKGYPMNAIGAEQRDRRITDLIFEIRKKCGVKTISKGFDLKSAIRCLKRGEILGVLIDQDVRDKGIVVPFLG
ncbi:MAG TPA: lysophospholipid acyltransferase family protein, partial [Synergistales bacterium]|nr:lysophospholipid acyltransferase family protein [Synergistales bacterium]